MRKFLYKFLFLLAAIILGSSAVNAERLVLLHTNDTHSLIDPDNGQGGVLQRKAIIDSVRKAEKNVILIDAGDVVQGTLYFKFFGGEVEYPLMNMMNYDIRILGNHEFDNGLDALAKHYKNVKGSRLSANYDFSATPLKGMFDPYVIRKIGGKKIGFIGINIDPASLISSENYAGMKFSDIIETANNTATYLKKDKKCDLVVVVSHIGVKKESHNPTDYELAAASHDIDIIIGGHSHTVINPGADSKFPSWVENADGRPVLVTQTGKYGKNLGYIAMDLAEVGGGGSSKFDYHLIPVTDRFEDGSLDAAIKRFIAPYKHVVDSVNHRVIAQSVYDLNSDQRAGGYANWAGDFAALYARRQLDSLRNEGKDMPYLDFALMNVGGIRQNMPAGDVTEGQILSTFPFSNHLVVASISGADFIEAMRIAAKKGGEAVSSEIRVIYDKEGNLHKVILNGHEMDPSKIYTYATIDYLAQGNDGMTSLSNGRMIWRDSREVSAPILEYVEEQGSLDLPIAPDLNPRFVKLP